MNTFVQLQTALRAEPRAWVVTGVAGFIGSNLLESLLRLGQRVVGLDNFSTGRQGNLDQVRGAVSPGQWGNFRFFQGDLANPDDCRQVCQGAEVILHQAALGSVPRSMADPQASHRSNVTGFLNLLVAAREAKVRRVVYASSSSVYGDIPDLPKVEERVGQPLSPYAATKAMNEVYAGVFARAFAFPCIGLRYFNVFGPRQDPDGAYAAVIPKWIASLLRSEAVFINGDGSTSRDFCYVANVVQANLLAGATANSAALDQVYNVALGERTSLNELFALIQQTLRTILPALPAQTPVYREFRPGDVPHSLADIAKARRLLGYHPTHHLAEGLALAMPWYLANVSRS